MTAAGGTPLSRDPRFDRALQALAAETLRWVEEPESRLRLGGAADPLLVVLGSGAAGEAVAAPLGGRLLPLSDLDLGLFLPRGVRPAVAKALRRSLRERLAPVAAAAGLTSDPVDLGITSLAFALRASPTLELCEAARRPCVLRGDPAPLRGLCAGGPPPFEALRLALNRIAELQDGPASDPAPGVWPREPDAPAWRRAHRTAKLPIDLFKALLAARGRLCASVQERSAWAPVELDGLPPSCLAAVRDWSAWRLEPRWPPPAAPDPAALAALTLAVVQTTFRALTGRAIDLSDRRDLRRLLAAEGGPARERARRWARLVAARPPGMSRAGALRSALGWAVAGVWPASLGTLAWGLVWARAAGVGPGAAALMENADEGAARMVHWARSAGV